MTDRSLSQRPEASQVREVRDLVTRYFGEAGTEDLLRRLLTFASLVREWNARGNLVSKRDAERLLSRHIPESLEIAAVVRGFAPRSILDLGSGAGFPGLPIALTIPSAQVVLLESRRMKSLFLLHAIQKLELSNCYAWCARVESLGPRVRRPDASSARRGGGSGSRHGTERSAEHGAAHGAERSGERSAHHEAERSGELPAGWSRLSVEPPPAFPPFDIVTARAVASLVTLARLAEPIVASGGRLVASKGSRLEDELREWTESPGGWALDPVQGDPDGGPGLVVLRRN